MQMAETQDTIIIKQPIEETDTFDTKLGAFPTQRDIETITEEIQYHQQQAVCAFIEIGKLLNEAKAKLAKFEKWEDWRENRLKMPERMAQRHMRLAREYPEPSPVTDLGISKATVLLALPPADRETFIEKTHMVDGIEKCVADMTRRELGIVISKHPNSRKSKPRMKSNAEKQSDDLIIQPIHKRSINQQEEKIVVFPEIVDDLNTDFDTDFMLVQSCIYGMLDYIAKLNDDPNKYNRPLA